MKALLLDAGGTLVFPNFRRIAAELAKDGVMVDPAALARAEAKVRFEIDRREVIMISDDAQRWMTYIKRLFEFMGTHRLPIAALLRLKSYHDEHNLWDFVPRGVPAALKELGKRYRLGVVSNSNGTVRVLLQRVGLADHFEVIVDSHEEKIEKPDPRIFRVALERMGINAAQTGYVGDLYHVDVIGARAAGLRPFLLDPLNLYSDKDVTRIKSLIELKKLPAERKPKRRSKR